MSVEPPMSHIDSLTKIAPLSRRGFMTTGAAAAAGYTLAAGPVRADAIHTSTDGLNAGMAEITVPEGTMPAYFAEPLEAKKPPIILVAQEVFGLHEYVKDVTRRLAKLGAFAVVPDYYFRLGDVSKIYSVAKVVPIVNQKADAELFGDLDATLAWAVEQGGDPARIGMVGFCRGGRSVWVYSTHNANLKAGVAFYGGLNDPPASTAAMPKTAYQLAGEVKEPVLGLYAGQDPSITPDQVEKMKAALAAAHKTAEFHIYPNAPHGFHADYRPSYRKHEAEDAWRRMKAWFEKYGVLT